MNDLLLKPKYPEDQSDRRKAEEGGLASLLLFKVTPSAVAAMNAAHERGGGVRFWECE